MVDLHHALRPPAIRLGRTINQLMWLPFDSSWTPISVNIVALGSLSQCTTSYIAVNLKQSRKLREFVVVMIPQK